MKIECGKIFELPSGIVTDEDGTQWRATMITPFDTFYERIPDGKLPTNNKDVDND